MTYSEPVTLIGGARSSQAELNTALTFAPTLVAADGGAAVALSAGVRPARVIGDMDSLDPAIRAELADVVEHIAEQDSTDFMKCLSRIDAPKVLAVGFMGGRIDHQLSVLNVMARRSPQRVVVLSEDDAAAIVPTDGLTLDLPVGDRFALMPLGPARAFTEGLRWNLNGELMEPTGLVSSSNEVAGPVRIRVEGPVLVAVPAQHLSVLWDAL